MNAMTNSERIWSPELIKAAAAALGRQDAEKAKLAAMNDEEREDYIAAWAKRLATEQVDELSRISRENGGCDCGQPHG